MKASSILKKREHFLTWWKLVVKAPNYFHVSPLIKWRYAFRTFSANEYVWFRLDENDYRKYISNYERTLSREIDGKYKIVLDNKLIFEDVFGSVARVARSYAWVSGGHLYGRNGYQVDRESLIPFLKEKKEAVLKKEGERLLEKLSDGEHVITLEIGGRECSSEELAEHIRQLMLNGCSRLAFVIGGSLGLSSQVRQRADDHLSFSRLTFPHQLMRILVPEQLYRAFKIQKGEPYHK